MALNAKKPMKPEQAKGLPGTRIAKALGLEGKPITSVSINLFDDGATIVGVTYSLDTGQESAVAEVFKDFVLVDRDPETGRAKV